MDWPHMLERGAMDLLDTRRPRVLLIAFCLMLWLPGLFTLPPTDRDESRFAQASKQMIETGDYVRIMNGDEPRNRKPIGIHWLQAPFAMAARAAGLATENPIWPYRLPSVLGGLAAVLAVQAFGKRLVGRRAALLAAAMLASSVILIVETHLAKTDAALLGATTVCMGLLARAYLTPGALRWGPAGAFWLSLGVGILLKGPITPMVVGVTAASLVVWDRRAAWLWRLRPGFGLPLMALVVLPWFAAIGFATHGRFFQDAVGGDLGRKLASGDDAHGAPPGLHLLLLPLLAFPSSFAAVCGVPAAWRTRSDPAIRFLLAWVVPCWVVFEIVPTKLPHYTLPLYPALFLLAARALLGLPTAARGWRRGLVWGAPGVPGVVLAGGVLLLPAAIGMSVWSGAPAAVAVALVVWLAAQVERPVVALAAAPLFSLTLLGWELPRAAPLWIAPQVEQALVSHGRAGDVLGSVGFHEPSLMFRAGTATAMLPTGQAGAEALAQGRVATLLVSGRDEAAFESEAARLGLTPHAFATVAGFNYSRGRRTTLTLYTR